MSVSVLMSTVLCLVMCCLSVSVCGSSEQPKTTKLTKLGFIALKFSAILESMFVLLKTSGVIASLFIEISICFLAKRPSKYSHLKVVFSCEIAYAVGFNAMFVYSYIFMKDFLCLHVLSSIQDVKFKCSEVEKKQVLQFS